MIKTDVLRNRTAPNNEESSPAFPHRTLLCIAAGALLVRLGWIHYLGLAIEGEGAEYARLAENLFAGKGYVGILGGRQTLFPPLFPLLIGLVAKITGSAESAARAVSCVSGVVTIWPVYGLTRILGGRKSAIVAAILMALNGVMVALSGSSYSESTYFLLLLCALYFSLQAFSEVGIVNRIASGAFFGFAYLVRPEAIVYPTMVAGFLIGQAIVARQPIGRALARACVPLIVTLTLAAPYVGWLSINSGYFRWEGKGLINSIIAHRMNRGLSYIQAARGLGTNSEPEGVYLIADQFSFKSDTVANMKLVVESMASNLLPRVVDITKQLAHAWSFGGLGLIILAAIGVVASVLQERARIQKLLFLSVGASYMILLLSMQHRWFRYLFPFALFLLPWAAIGITTIANAIVLWGRATTGLRTTASAFVSLLLIVIVAVPSLVSVRDVGEFSQSSELTLKDAGTWVAEFRLGDKIVMSTYPVLAYYARGDHAFLPWAPETSALRYIHTRRPDFIALRTQNQWQAPYMAKWLTDGIPDPCAVLRRGFTERREEKLVIYEWVCR